MVMNAEMTFSFEFPPRTETERPTGNLSGTHSQGSHHGAGGKVFVHVDVNRYRRPKNNASPHSCLKSGVVRRRRETSQTLRLFGYPTFRLEYCTCVLSPYFPRPCLSLINALARSAKA